MRCTAYGYQFPRGRKLNPAFAQQPGRAVRHFRFAKPCNAKIFFPINKDDVFRPMRGISLNISYILKLKLIPMLLLTFGKRRQM